MRTTIVRTYCDDSDHGEEEVSADTYRLGLSADGGRWHWVEVDLCEPHAKPVVDLVGGLVEVGRTFEAPNGVSRAKRTNGDRLPCPECGRSFRAPQGLAVHRSRSHGVPAGSTPGTKANP